MRKLKQSLAPLQRLLPDRISSSIVLRPGHSDTRLESRPTPWIPIAVGGAITGLVLVGVALSTLVKVDQLVRAPGQLEPIRSTQDLKVPEGGVVTAIFVKEGQLVNQGQALAQLDPTILRSRAQALRDQQRQLKSSTRQEILRLQGSLGELQATRQGLRSNQIILEQQLKDVRELQSHGAASQFQVLEYEKQLAEVNSKLAAISQQERRLKAESAQKQAELNNQQAQNRAVQVETETRLGRVTLRAPARGTILNLRAKTGSVASPGGEPLLQLVPTDHLQAKVFVSNQDLAFVQTGQQADISVAAYDPSRYGYLHARVTTIGTDALPADTQYKFSRFPITLKLTSQSLTRDGARLTLQAGMAVMADLKLEKRSIFELMVSSLTQAGRSLQGMR